MRNLSESSQAQDSCSSGNFTARNGVEAEVVGSLTERGFRQRLCRAIKWWLGPVYGPLKSSLLKSLCRTGTLTRFCPQFTPVKLHLGCGEKYLEGYLNIDLFNKTADIHADCCELSFLKDASVTHILCEHVLEHLSRDQGWKALKEWARVLALGGELELEVPDLLWCIENFASSSEDARYGGEYELQGAIAALYGMQTSPGQFHKFGYSPEYLKKCVEANHLRVVSLKCYITPHPCRSIRILARREA